MTSPLGFRFFILVVGITGSSQLKCSTSESCRDCIQLSGDCFWCTDPMLQGPRCMASNETCSGVHRENPRGRVNSLTQQQLGGIEQFTPVAADLELRVGEPKSFRVAVTPTANYPLDVYILMDLSFSMSPYLNHLRTVSAQLANSLHSITANFRIGFGGFNEKPIIPFVPVVPELMIRPFTTDYSFRHIVSLTSNVTSFRSLLPELDSLVANNDGPEALLEGLLQAVVCRDEIGWRREARKLVLVFTDQHYHVAGDGKIAGLIRPSDGNCHVSHVSSTGHLDYTMWGRLDYPSIGLVRSKLQENDIIPIFAAVSRMRDVYMDLVQLIPGSIFQSIGDGSNVDPNLILQIIENSYNATSQRIELIPVTEAERFLFTITPTCPTDSTRDDSACNNVQINNTAYFDFSVTLTQCPLETQTVALRIVGFGAISLTLSGVCGCPCEAEKEFNSSLCTGQGDQTCAVCECHESRFGERCQCDSPGALNLPCPFGVTHNMFCSSRGRCECGVCLCNQPSPNQVPLDVENATIYGDGCECDNFNCPKGINNLVCSGRGECECNRQCSCSTSPLSLLPYRGDSCQCAPVEEVCLNPADESVCSNHGECQCNGCQCELGREGQYCNITLKELESCDRSTCVECAEDIASPETNCNQLNCSVVFIDAVSDNETEYLIEGTPALMCDFLDSNNCLRVYYTIGSVAPTHAERAECGGLPIPVWAIVVIVVGAVLLVAFLILIIIKCVLLCMDRYEVYRWEKERNECTFGNTENPTYISPEQKYDNIAYGLESPKKGTAK